jgi:hypothetical protein
MRFRRAAARDGNTGPPTAQSSDHIALVPEVEEPDEAAIEEQIAKIDKNLRYLIPLLKSPEAIRTFLASGLRSTAGSLAASNRSDNSRASSLALADVSIHMNTILAGESLSGSASLSRFCSTYINLLTRL